MIIITAEGSGICHCGHLCYHLSLCTVYCYSVIPSPRAYTTRLALIFTLDCTVQIKPLESHLS